MLNFILFYTNFNLDYTECIAPNIDYLNNIFQISEFEKNSNVYILNEFL